MRIVKEDWGNSNQQGMVDGIRSTVDGNSKARDKLTVMALPSTVYRTPYTEFFFDTLPYL